MTSNYEQVNKRIEKRNSWSFIPTQYFAEGLPYIIVNNLSVVMYKSLNVANDLIGYTSFLYLPWAVKLFWAPFIDSKSTKRHWVLILQLLLAIAFGILVLGIQLPSFFTITLLIFTVISFISATHDIVTDGFYLHALNKKDQAFFTGIRSTFYRLSMIFGSGILVIVAGSFTGTETETKFGWSLALAIPATLFLVFYLYHKFILPYPKSDFPIREVSSIPFKTVFTEYFTQKKILIILAYILLYRFGEGLLVKMAQPFLLDDLSKGGLGLSVSEVGLYYGTLGMVALLAGGILGGWMIKKYSLKQLIWIMAFFMNVPNLLYVYLAAVQPESLLSIDLSRVGNIFNSADPWIITFHPIIQLCVIIEQFGYGFGFTAFMVFLLYISKGKYKTSHYAISTGIMAVGMMIPGFISGWFQVNFGYLSLFMVSVIMTIPGMLIIFFLPLDVEKNSGQD